VQGIEPVFNAAVVLQSVLAVGAAMLGTLIAVALFVFAVMRS